MKTSFYSIEAEAQAVSKKDKTRETYLRWLEDEAGEYIIKKTFQSGRLIQSGIYDLHKITREK